MGTEATEPKKACLISPSAPDTTATAMATHTVDTVDTPACTVDTEDMVDMVATAMAIHMVGWVWPLRIWLPILDCSGRHRIELVQRSGSAEECGGNFRDEKDTTGMRGPDCSVACESAYLVHMHHISLDDKPGQNKFAVDRITSDVVWSSYVLILFDVNKRICTMPR